MQVMKIIRVIQIMRVTQEMKMIRPDGKSFPDCKKRLEILEFYQPRECFCPPGQISTLQK